MTKTKFLKPASPEIRVPLEPPATGCVSTDGEELPMRSFYRRRILEGTLVEVERPRAQKSGKSGEAK